VADTGCGIPAEALPNIFDRFYQTDSRTTRSKGGLGLGLAIVRYLTELQGGTVDAESPGADQGTTFTVNFPAMGDGTSCTSGFIGADSVQTGSLILDNVRVLAVDDEPDARSLVALMLEQVGANVRTAQSVEEALTVMSDFQPDVLVSDIGIPDEDGYSLARQIHSLSSGKSRIPMVALTAYAQASDRDRALEAGFDYHIPKPVEPAELISILAKLTNKANGPVKNN
jgi:CheY-like chemotaxis protein